MAGPIAKDISNEFSISPKRTAAILDIFYLRVAGNYPLWRPDFICVRRCGRGGYDPVASGIVSLLVLSDFNGNQCGSVYPVFGNRKKSKN